MFHKVSNNKKGSSKAEPTSRPLQKKVKGSSEDYNPIRFHDKDFPEIKNYRKGSDVNQSEEHYLSEENADNQSDKSYGVNIKTENKKKSERHDNSLSILTKKFVQLIREAPEQTIDLNEAVRELQVQKRRIYDITNVLEGIGYIEKASKNKLKWVSNKENLELEAEIAESRLEIERLRREEEEKNAVMNTIQSMLFNIAHEGNNSMYSYVTFDDIKSINSLSKDNSQSFLVIRAPKGTELEVPEIDEQLEKSEFPHIMNLRSQNEEISIYVVSNDRCVEDS